MEAVKHFDSGVRVMSWVTALRPARNLLSRVGRERGFWIYSFFSVTGNLFFFVSVIAGVPVEARFHDHGFKARRKYRYHGGQAFPCHLLTPLHRWRNS